MKEEFFPPKSRIIKEYIFKYDDISDYLKAWYKKNKKRDLHFSYRFLQKKLNYQSPSSVFRIFKKGKFLNDQSVNTVIKLMKLSNDEIDYFKILAGVSKLEINNRLKKELIEGYRYIKKKQKKKL